jgi:hypothetical protein
VHVVNTNKSQLGLIITKLIRSVDSQLIQSRADLLGKYVKTLKLAASSAIYKTHFQNIRVNFIDLRTTLLLNSLDVPDSEGIIIDSATSLQGSRNDLWLGNQVHSTEVVHGLKFNLCSESQITIL